MNQGEVIGESRERPQHKYSERLFFARFVTHGPTMDKPWTDRGHEQIKSTTRKTSDLYEQHIRNKSSAKQHNLASQQNPQPPSKQSAQAGLDTAIRIGVLPVDAPVAAALYG